MLSFREIVSDDAVARCTVSFATLVSNRSYDTNFNVPVIVLKYQQIGPNKNSNAF